MTWAPAQYTGSGTPVSSAITTEAAYTTLVVHQLWVALGAGALPAGSSHRARRSSGRRGGGVMS